MPPTDPPGDPVVSDGIEGDGGSGGRSGSDEGDRLLAALQTADRREPWTVKAVREIAAYPAGTKATASVCTSCDAPCGDDEVCVTVIADEVGLFNEGGRERAFHLIESAAKRLRMSDEGRIREEDDRRPNVFFSLSAVDD